MNTRKASTLMAISLSILTSIAFATTAADPLPQKSASSEQVAPTAIPSPGQAQATPTPTVTPTTTPTTDSKGKNDSTHESELALKLKWVDFWITIPGILASIILSILGNRKTEVGKTGFGGALSGLGAIAGICIVGILFLLVVLPRRVDVRTQPSNDHLRAEFARLWDEQSRATKTLGEGRKSTDRLLQQIEEIRHRSGAIESRLKQVETGLRDLEAANVEGQPESLSQSVLLNGFLSLNSDVRRTEVSIGRMQSTLEQIEGENAKVSRYGFVFVGITAMMVVVAVITLIFFAWRKLMHYSHLMERQKQHSRVMQGRYEKELGVMQDRFEKDLEYLKRKFDERELNIIDRYTELQKKIELMKSDFNTA